MANLMGGLSGAGTGAAIGSAFTPLGTAIGAGLGGLIGLFGGPSAPSIDDPTKTVAGQQAATNIQKAQDYQRLLEAMGGPQNLGQVYGQQQALADVLQQRAMGQGPSVAQAQLAQATGQNVAQQAALMAGQRGAGANVGLIGRQAAQIGSQAQQQAAGQLAALRAQEMLANTEALQRQQAMLGGTAGSQIGYTQQGYGQLGQLTAEQQRLLLEQQKAQAGISTQQQAAGAQALGAALTPFVKSGTGTAQTPDFKYVPESQRGAAQSGDWSFGAMQPMAEGGAVQQGGPEVARKENYKGKSEFGRMLMAEGGKVHNMKTGGHVPGKPKVGGAVNSYANDTVKALLSPGEIVLPRSVTQSPDPVAAAARFVAAMKSKKGK